MNIIQKSSAGAVFLALLLAAVASAQTPWTRLDLPGGGVADDICFLYHDEAPRQSDQIWSACMNGGCFRSAWNSGAWGDWEEFFQGIPCYGVDAVEVNGTEYVLAAGKTGVFRSSGAQGNVQHLGISHWFDGFPTGFKTALFHDAAFYWPPGGAPGAPLAQFYAILKRPVAIADLRYNPGVYRWKSSISTFERVDEGSPNAPAHSYGHFQRDLAAPHLLYLDRRLEEEDAGGLFRLTCGATYDLWTFERVQVSAGTDRDLLGFNQWPEGAVVHSYALLQWRDNGGCLHVGAFHSVNLDAEQPEFTLLGDYTDYFGDGTQDWLEISHLTPYACAGIVGRPAGSNQHRLWLINDEGWGMWYDQTGDPNPPVQINGAATPDAEPALKSWSVRSLLPDAPHLQAGQWMRLFLGTHQHGQWYLTHYDDGGYTWAHLAGGYTGTDVRDVRLLGNQVLAPAFKFGIWEWSGGAWTQLGVSGCSGRTDPRFDRLIYAGAKLGGDYYFGSGPEIKYFGDDPTQPDYTLVVGGLYRIRDGQTAAVEFDPDLNTPANSVYYQVSDLDAADGRLYVCTGHLGPEICALPPGETKVNIVSLWDGAAWDRIYAAGVNGGFDNTGFLCLSADPLAPADRIYLGLGNFWGWVSHPTVTTWGARVLALGRVEGVWQPQPLWSWSLTPNHDDFYSVFDISALADPLHPNHPLIYWALGRYDETNSAYAAPVTGKIFRRAWDPATQDYVVAEIPLPETMDDITWAEPPACMAIRGFSFRGNRCFLVYVKGDVNCGIHPLPRHREYTFCYLDAEIGRWHYLGLPFQPDDENYLTMVLSELSNAELGLQNKAQDFNLK
jgi:hypothetical protein